MSITVLPPADGGDPLARLRLEVGEWHAAFCARPADCDGVCTEVTDLDAATLVTSVPAGVQPQFRIATPTGEVVLSRDTAVAAALLILSRAQPSGIPAPGLRRTP